MGVLGKILLNSIFLKALHKNLNMVELPEEDPAECEADLDTVIESESTSSSAAKKKKKKKAATGDTDNLDSPQQEMDPQETIEKELAKEASTTEALQTLDINDDGDVADEEEDGAGTT